MEKCIVFISPAALHMMDDCSIRYVKSMGFLSAVAIDRNINCTLDVDFVIHTNTNHADTLICDLAFFNQKHEIAGIVTYSDFHVEVTALANQYFGLPGTNYNAVLKCKNKSLCRMELNKYGWKQPAYRVISCLEDFITALDEIGVPCVLKPINGMGSAFTMLINDKKEACQEFERLRQAKESSVLGKETALSSNWILEECLTGFQISVESFTCNGQTTILCIHDKLNPIVPPLFRVFYSATPSSRISENLEAKIKEKTLLALKAIGFNHGVAHTEFRVAENGDVNLLEINARTGGGLIIPSAYYSTGINLYTVAIDLALGRTPEITRNAKPYPVVFRVVYPPKSGKLVEFSGFEKLLDDSDFQMVVISAREGDMVTEGERLALILKKGYQEQTVDEIVKAIDKKIDTVKIIVEKAETGNALPSHINNSAH